MEVLAALLFTLACNLDTVLLAALCALRGRMVSAGPALMLSAATTGITWLSMLLGRGAASVLPTAAAGMLGGLAMAAVGLWYLLDALRGEDAGPPLPAPGLTGWFSLAAALAGNNAGAGLAAGAAGIAPGLAAPLNFLVTLLALPLGRRLGARLSRGRLGRLALPLSGVLLLVLGLWEAFT